MTRMKRLRRRVNATTIATWNLNERLIEQHRQEELLADVREATTRRPQREARDE